MNPMTRARRRDRGAQTRPPPRRRLRRRERREDAQRRRLPGTIGPDQAEDLALRDGEVDPGDRQRPVVALDEALGAHDLAHRTEPSIQTPKVKLMPSGRAF
jgi:hypothetical protein